MNAWLYAFLVSLVVFILLIDRRSFQINVWGGVISAVYQLIQNILAYSYGLWAHNEVGFHLPHSVLFSNEINIFTVGIAFTMGTLFLQFLPRNLLLQFIHAAIWLIFFTLVRYTLLSHSFITIFHWSFYLGRGGLTFMLGLAWFKTFFLKHPTPAGV